jgi:hypothetical protein
MSTQQDEIGKGPVIPVLELALKEYGGVAMGSHLFRIPQERDPISQSQSPVATDGQSVGPSWCRAPSGAHDQIPIYQSRRETLYTVPHGGCGEGGHRANMNMMGKKLISASAVNTTRNVKIKTIHFTD